MAASTLQQNLGVVNKQRGSKSFEDAMERTLDKGVTLRASDRLHAISTHGARRARLVVTISESSPIFLAGLGLGTGLRAA
jgi:hypothetical protein